MKITTSNGNTVTMTSLELVEFINSQRQDGDAELRHADFLAKVPQVLGEEMSEKFRSSFMMIATTHDCAAYLIDRRFSCRRIAQFLSAIHDENSQDRRQARKFRETNNPILMRRADTLEAQAKRRSDALQNGRDLLLKWGRELIELSPHIDAAVSQPLLLDLLNVNRADRERVSQEDGLIEIAYIKGLEDSAMYRCDGWKQGPLAQAVMRAINHELLHNDQLKQAAHEHLFGKGGMFEFLPTYRMAPSGEMERQPPKLRLADECDAKNEVA